jgi:hypothetical protein
LYIYPLKVLRQKQLNMLGCWLFQGLPVLNLCHNWCAFVSYFTLNNQAILLKQNSSFILTQQIK